MRVDTPMSCREIDLQCSNSEGPAIISPNRVKIKVLEVRPTTCNQFFFGTTDAGPRPSRVTI